MARKRSRSERERDKIASRRCVTNRYIDVPTLERIGLHDQVVEILHSCGWTGLLEMRDVTYPDLVREFISEFEFLDEDEDQEGMFRFKVRNLEIEMTLGDVRELFGWPAEGQAGTPPLEDAVLAWKEITGGEVAFDPGRTVESGMRRELYCYLHRVISCTIYGRENGQEKVSQIDHDLLYYLHRRVPVDFVRLLGSRLQEIRYMDGPLMCGGFVTRIVSGIAGFDIERNYRGRLELNKASYFLTILDDFSRASWVFLMQSKSETAPLIKQFSAMVNTQFHTRLQRVRSDNGAEFISLRSFFNEQGILFETSCVYTPQQNGRVERKHRHILNVACWIVRLANYMREILERYPSDRWQRNITLVQEI